MGGFLSNMAGRRPEDYTPTVRRLDEVRPGAWDPAERIKDKDIDGVDAEVLYVGGPLQVRPRTPALRLNSVRGYNRWLSDFASYAARRLLGVAAIPIDTPETRRRGGRARRRRLGLRGRLHPAVPTGGRLRRRRSGTPCGRRSSTPTSRSACTSGPPARHPVVDMYETGAAVHDRPRGEQADDGGSGLGADPRPVVAALPGAAGSSRSRARSDGSRSSQYYSDHLWEKHRFWTESKLRGATEPLLPAAGLRHLHGGPGRAAGAPPHRDRQHHVGERLPALGDDLAQLQVADRRVVHADYGDEDKAKILWKNAARVHGIDL